ncbi:hypothetical protein ACTFIR_000011 [Dictyostelium discoideum]
MIIVEPISTITTVVSQRAIEFENKGVGRYEIEYYSCGKCTFDRQDIKYILSAVGKLERLDSVSYLVNGALANGKTLEPLIGIIEQLSEFSKLKTIFKDLSVLGDMSIILYSTRDTFKQYIDIDQQANDTERASNLKNILYELQSFIKALDTTEEDESKFEEQFDKVKNRSNVINQVY